MNTDKIKLKKIIIITHLLAKGISKGKITNHYGTQILTLKTIKQKLNIFTENFIYPFSDQTSQVDHPSK
jgi:hypothetical protein